VYLILLGVVNVETTEALAIELTKNLLINGQDEKPKHFEQTLYGDFLVVMSDDRHLYFNRVEVEHARLILKKGEKNEN
jgi:hypothetical protein